MSSWMRLRSWSVSMARQATAFPLRREPLHPPPGRFVGVAGREEAVVEPIRATLPELDGGGGQAVSAPVRWPGDRSVRESGRDLLHVLIELVAISQDRALGRCPGSDLRLTRPGREVGVGLGVIHPSNVAGHGHLPVERFPQEHQGRPRVLLELSTLAAAVIRVEDETPLIGLAEEDVTDGWAAVGSR